MKTERQSKKRPGKKQRRNAWKKLKRLREEYTEVAPFKVKPDMRFGDWMNYWYENHCKPSIRPTTQKGYEEWIYVHAIPGLGHIPLNKLTQAGCQKFLNEMKANGRKTHRDTKGPEMAERSVRSCYHVIQMALDRAVKDGFDQEKSSSSASSSHLRSRKK